jgi:transcriptional regulator with XRE-family HTH domain
MGTEQRRTEAGDQQHPDPRKRLGEVLHAIRLREGLSLEELAERLGRPNAKGRFSEYENGVHLPQPRVLRDYAKQFPDAVQIERLLMLRGLAVKARKVGRRHEEPAAARVKEVSQDQGDAEQEDRTEVHEKRRSLAGAVLAAVILALVVTGTVVALGGKGTGANTHLGRNGPGWGAPPGAGSGTTLVVDSRSLVGAHGREDLGPPLQLTLAPRIGCHCAVSGTERRTGQFYEHAVCRTHGDWVTNSNLNTHADDHNPGLASTTLYYAVRLDNGQLGFVSAVWITTRQRYSTELPACISPR